MNAVDAATLGKLHHDIGGDATTIRELTDAFFRQTPKLLEDARVAAARGDQAPVHRTAHTLKSSALLFGAARLADLSRALESDSESALPPRAPARVAALAEEYGRVERDLRAWLEGYQK